jgi:phage baseplate assembly protein W
MDEMSYQVTGEINLARVDFAPAGIVKEVLQNIRTLITTAKYSVPLDRDLGIDASFLDRPAPDALARLRVRIAEEIHRREPRAKVDAIEFRQYEGAMSGTFYPVVHVEIKGGE